jgi:hypothetical protein
LLQQQQKNRRQHDIDEVDDAEDGELILLLGELVDPGTIGASSPDSESIYHQQQYESVIITAEGGSEQRVITSSKLFWGGLCW